MNPTSNKPASARWGFAPALLVLVLLLAGLFAPSFESGRLLFSSDGPLGGNAAAFAALPSGFTGMWNDLNWVGGPAGSALPSTTYLLLWAIGPLGFAKFFAPLSLLGLGVAVWVCFRQTGFRPLVCALGALAAVLNTDFFSYACWGLGTTTLSMAWMFLAVAALLTKATPRWWLKTVLAGLAIGMAVIEGFDVGAILSLFLAAFAFFLAWGEGGTAAGRLTQGVGRVTVLAVAAGLIAASTLTVLIGTQVQGVAAMAQDAATKRARWEEATQWSLPKIETLRVVVPGLFGYRMDTPEGGNYWGRVGESPTLARHSGAGVYAGVLVVLVALWAFLQSLCRSRSLFTPDERRLVWFWSGAALVSLLFAWGRHAPFYQLLYALPYFSTIRNPIKFTHPFSVAVLILFGYGLHGLTRATVGEAMTRTASLTERLKAWWRAAGAFDRRWFAGCGAAVAAALLLWLLYAASSAEVATELSKSFGPKLADQIVAFSLREVGWAILFLVLSVVLLALIAAGIFAGHRTWWAAFLLGGLLVTDGVRANAPWINYFSFDAQYSPTYLTRFLGKDAHEHRVAAFPVAANEQLKLLKEVYAGDWMQHGFRYYNVQSFDIVQDPRPTVENVAFRTAFYRNGAAGFLRMLQLTNARWMLGLAGDFADTVLNAQFDPVRKRFRIHQPFTLEQAGAGAPILIQTNSAGPLALIEFTGALPRARLFAHWQVNTNDEATLATLSDPGFDPAQTVLVSQPLTASASPTAADPTNSSAGTVEYLSYAPKQTQLKATVTQPAVLLLNDKFDPHWKATVDGQPAELLRCNYLMRGVHLRPGEHVVEFRYGIPTPTLMVSVATIAAGLGLLGLVIAEGRRRPFRPAPATESDPPPQPPPPATKARARGKSIR